MQYTLPWSPCLVTLLVVSGCPGSDPIPDFDGDGWEDSNDCEPEDPAIHPGAEELCDGIDNDCDGELDEGCNAGDLDGDGWTEADGDCDDGDAEINPGAHEQPCDDVDNDCDEATVDDPDADGDGYNTCGEGECDDGDADVHAGATEQCNDGVDNDCDGTPNDCLLAGTIGLDTAAVKITGPAAGAMFGLSVRGGRDVTGDGVDDVLIGAPGEAGSEGEAEVGAAYLLSGADLASGPVTGTAEARLHGGGPTHRCGFSVDFAGDVNGNGREDLLIGAAGAGAVGAGAVYIVHGPVSGDLDIDMAAAARLNGEVAGDMAGYTVAGAGDVDVDGYADVLVGAPLHYGVGLFSGRAYLLFGPLTGSTTLAYADRVFDGLAAGDMAGGAVAAAGDVDGDGRGDILVAAVEADDGGEDSGVVYLLSGPVAEGVTLATADASILGAAPGDLAGRTVAGAGDVDGDGHDDILVGAHDHDGGASNTGAAYLVHGPISGTVDLATEGIALTGESADDQAGWSVAPAGDVDGDGHADLLVGVFQIESAGSQSGGGYLLYGPVTAGSLASANAEFLGESPDDWAGFALWTAGDVDADGYDDLIIGAHQESTAGALAGAVYVVGGLGL